MALHAGRPFASESTKDEVLVPDGSLRKHLLVEGSGPLCSEGSMVSLLQEVRIKGKTFLPTELELSLDTATSSGTEGLLFPGMDVAIRSMREGERAIFQIDASLLSTPASAERQSDRQLPWSDADGFEWVEAVYEWDVLVKRTKLVSIGLRPSLPIGMGIRMPRFGLGFYMMSPGDAFHSASKALSLGYRLLDTASMYQNEEAVGRGILDSRIPREDIFIVSKVNNPDHGYQEALKACNTSRSVLGVDSLDLYLIHSPLGGRLLETWDALLEARRRGWVKQVGVSNFGMEHLQQLEAAGREMPAVNQIELSPFCQEWPLRLFCAKKGITVMGYSPLTRGERLRHPVLARVAHDAGRSPAQILLRWALQHGIVTIPKTVRPERMQENLGAFDFELTSEQLQTLAELDEQLHTCWNCLSVPWQG